MSPSQRESSLELAVVRLSKDLAFTNKVFVSPSTLTALGIPSNKKRPVVQVGPHPYVVEAHPYVKDGQIGLNRFQREETELSLAAPVSVKNFRPPSNFVLDTIEFSVDLRRSQNGSHKVNTNQLASVLYKAMKGQPFEPGRKHPMNFQGTKLELTCKNATPSVVALESGGSEAASAKYPNMGRLVRSTAISFSLAEGASAIKLVGDRVEGGGAGTNLFLSDLTLKSLVLVDWERSSIPLFVEPLLPAFCLLRNCENWVFLTFVVCYSMDLLDAVKHLLLDRLVKS